MLEARISWLSEPGGGHRSLRMVAPVGGEDAPARSEFALMTPMSRLFRLDDL
jgi:hypothetical protein